VGPLRAEPLGGTLVIARIMDTRPTGILIIVVTTTIRIGITGIGTGTDGQSATKPH